MTSNLLILRDLKPLNNVGIALCLDSFPLKIHVDTNTVSSNRLNTKYEKLVFRSVMSSS